jgi:folate-binding protein YgfZ
VVEHVIGNDGVGGPIPLSSTILRLTGFRVAQPPKPRLFRWASNSLECLYILRMYFTLLPKRAMLAVSGGDAETFLQGLVSNDLRKLSSGAVYAAMLSPQGKFLHDFFLIRRGDAILMDCDSLRVNDLLSRLTLYKLRAAVNIEKLPDAVTAAWGKKTEQGYADPRLPAMGYRIIGAAKTDGWQEKTFDDYEAHRLALGIPDGAQDMLIDKSFLLELGFESLHGVDFNKGCYVGQEVTARSKFRGQVRKHIYQVRADGELPPLGTPIVQDGAEVGQLRSHAGNIGLAIIRIEAVEKNSPLTADGKTIAASFPIWANADAA